jgi:hypothetical protein
MALTGLPDRPLGPPERLVTGVDRLGQRFANLDPLALLGERAALSDLHRRGATSCGGSCRLLATADGWVAISLPRPYDLEAVPAWLELDSIPDTPTEAWSVVTRTVAGRSTGEVVSRAVLLGLPVAGVGEVRNRAPVLWHRLGDAPPSTELHGILVVDLSAMWAGPLCGDLLAREGATVVKVESTSRPDGARGGPKAFFDLLNGSKRSVALDLPSRDGLRALRDLLRRADVVVESARPRALEQLGIVASELVAGGGPRTWVSITGYGRAVESGNRVAFGDDAAAAGGLVVHEDGIPLFCGDAIADPLTGLAAADACLQSLHGGGRWLLDVSMSAVSADLGGPTLSVPPGAVMADPKARPVTSPAPPLGAHTSEVLELIGVRP